LWIHAGLSAQTTGKIVGHVTDTNTGSPLFGANVMVVGTNLGASADQNGDFFIINVAPGQYTIRVTMMGYQSTLIQKVVVSTNRTSTIETKMSETAVEGQTVVITADKVVIKKDQTSSIKNVSSEQISMLPVQEVQEVIEMQAGVIGGHFRGGRLDEVSYLIDGVQVDETFRHENSTVELEKEVIQDLEVITGTFNAEYGKAMSGIVNMVTKDGSNAFHGSVYGALGNFFTPHDDIFIGLKPEDVMRQQDYKIQLEGPIWKNRINFIANVRYVDEKNAINGIRRFNVDDYSNFTEPDILGDQTTPWDALIPPDRYYSEHTGDGSIVRFSAS
jgi:hypothetical protein